MGEKFGVYTVARKTELSAIEKPKRMMIVRILGTVDSRIAFPCYECFPEDCGKPFEINFPIDQPDLCVC